MVFLLYNYVYMFADQNNFFEAISHPYISFFHLLVNGFSVTSFRTFFEDPLPLLYWWAVSVGGKELKWRQLNQSAN